MSRLAALSLGLLLALQAGCSLYTEGDWFYVRSNGADMPVWVKGDPGSGDFIVSLHGGPGGSATAFGLLGWQELEANHAVVYWDQRHAGNSQGDADPDATTVASYTEDLELVLDVLRERYDVQRVVLWGTSWGGTVGVHFLASGEGSAARRAGVHGFVFEHGNYSAQRAYGYSRPWSLEQSIIRSRTETEEGEEFWLSCVDFYERTPQLTQTDDWSTHYACMSSAGGAEAPVENENALGAVPPEFIFASPASGPLMGWNQRASQQSESFLEEFVLDDQLSQDMAVIDIPMLVMQGRFDRVAPWEVGRDLIEAIATPDDQKRELILEDSGHQWGGDDFAIAERAVGEFVEGLAR